MCTLPVDKATVSIPDATLRETQSSQPVPCGPTNTFVSLFSVANTDPHVQPAVLGWLDNGTTAPPAVVLGVDHWSPLSIDGLCGWVAGLHRSIGAFGLGGVVTIATPIA